MDRAQRILGTLFDPGSPPLRAGAEIGPLHRALVPKSAVDRGAVFYVDHCDTETLKAKWRSDPSVDLRA